ncbi:ECF transporter S component [Streptococcus loxodontisalivarius]|uniref:Membrane protein n=1 Tax=Streptococcus loxodontisalivarius TaxID=1349415 RepID=A0ABS2PRH7_9STRE|nr:ECF transporter S component [Streptococcus loxodontisalivarius]MBM7641992.1 putative membrane protein [Streptococcus loxodontisalivarius]
MTTRRLSISAIFMALVIILSASIFSIPVPGGHFYFNTILIFLVAMIFPATEAVIIAGVGSFFGDFFFYPAPMFVTLITHSLQVLVIALLLKNKELRPDLNRLKVVSILALGAVIDLIGYFLGRSFVYATPEYALLKLPFDSLGVLLGIAGAYLLYFHTGFLKEFKKVWK